VLRSVTSRLEAEVLGDAALELQVAVAGPAPQDELLEITLDGQRLTPRELVTDVGGRLHVLRCGPGRLEVRYSARVAGHADPAVVRPLDESVYLRPSRYAPSDRLAALAQAEFGSGRPARDLVRDVAAWVGARLSYVIGSSTGTDDAVDTLLAGAGVCRDYAHLVVALLRAGDVPARLVSVYAPGLHPMDFHAVVEALVDGSWHVVDATLLAPRQSLVRIATGRDAADTAFLSSTGGEVRLGSMQVTAVVEGDLPTDDIAHLVQLR
jgi:transglutaminase-like putative cysteine protease